MNFVADRLRSPRSKVLSRIVAFIIEIQMEAWPSG